MLLFCTVLKPKSIAVLITSLTFLVGCLKKVHIVYYCSNKRHVFAEGCGAHF